MDDLKKKDTDGKKDEKPDTFESAASYINDQCQPGKEGEWHELSIH